nr:type II toxin-antitoxin system YhaV family toxin [uncultured Rhodopila sp.]
MQRHGWTLFATPLFVDQVEKLIDASERARRSDPVKWQSNASVKLLATLMTLVLERIPRDPLAPDFRQGNTLGAEHRHWFRAKFAANRFRLFFRADSASRIIVYAWVNDRDTLRKAGASTDPYALFSGMLKRGNPPGGWPALLAEGQAASERFTAAINDQPPPKSR